MLVGGCYGVKGSCQVGHEMIVMGYGVARWLLWVSEWLLGCSGCLLGCESLFMYITYRLVCWSCFLYSACVVI